MMETNVDRKYGCISCRRGPVYLEDGVREVPAPADEAACRAASGASLARQILDAHDRSETPGKRRIVFDALASHDITYVGIIQTARASGLTQFPLPYVLTNCHNSLCAVGGTINEDDHVFGLSAAKKYGGIYVPAHQAVIHSYMRECMSGCGKMILGSDSHTRYGALGTMAVGEGGPELVKQLLGRSYDIDDPEVIAVRLSGKPRAGVGPQDVAIALIGAVFADGFVKNKVLEFVGDGIASLSADFRCGIDVMTTETACLSSIWETDDVIREYFALHGRPEAYRELRAAGTVRYDGLIDIDLSAVEPMIALPCHPSNALPLAELIAHPAEVLHAFGLDALQDKIHDGALYVDQGVVAGCAGGTYENVCEVSDVLASLGGERSMELPFSVYPASQPVFTALTENGVAASLLREGVSLRSAFCGPCFGAGDVPANGGLSIRHTTRNFPNREGSKPGAGQTASVALMDARSIAATAACGGKLTSALGCETPARPYHFDDSCYRKRVYYGFGHAQPELPLHFGPNITDWPAMPALGKDLLVRFASVILDPVTTTDELIPSGETSSYRSNPRGLAEFTLSRKDPGYVARAKAAAADAPCRAVLDEACRLTGGTVSDLQTGSTIYAVKPGDGSAREQAASCQRVLGGLCNVASEYATKRYRSNLINWGMLPLLCDAEAEKLPFAVGDYLLIPGVREAVESGQGRFDAFILHEDGSSRPLSLRMDALTEDERKILLAGCLINFYRN